MRHAVPGLMTATLALAAGLIAGVPLAADPGVVQHEQHHGTHEAVGGSMKTPTAVFDSAGRLWRAWVEGEHVVVSVSEDAGRTFRPETRVTTEPEDVDANGESRPKIAIGPGGEVYVTWTRYGQRAYTGDVRFSRSLDGGRTFDAPRTVNDDGLETGHRFDALAVAPHGTIYVAWIDKRDLERATAAGAEYEGAALYYTVSRDRGASFAANRKIKDHICECCRIAHAFDAEGRLVLFWRDVMTGSIRDHALIRLTPDGPAGAVQRVTADDWQITACPHHGPGLAFGNFGIAHVVWFTGAGPQGPGAFYGRLSAEGHMLGTPIRLGPAEPTTGHAVVHADGDMVSVAWKERRGDGAVVKLMQSTDAGATFGAPRELARAAGAADHPFLLDSPDGLRLSWYSEQEGYRLLPVP